MHADSSPLHSLSFGLEMARDPEFCPMGHVACRSCYLEDILAQKNSFKVEKSEYDRKISEMNEKKRAEENNKTGR